MTEKYKTRQTLIERVRDQYDDSAWAEFVEIYEPYIYAVIRRMGIEVHDAKDIHQNTLLSIWKHLPEYSKQTGTRFRGWVAAIAGNAVKQFIRSKTNQAKKLDTAASDATLSYLKTIKLPEIDSIAEKEWEVYLTNLAMKNIEKVYTGQAIEVFQKTLDGLEVNEIAQELELSAQSVYTLRARVKQSLTKEIIRLRQDLE